MTQVDARSEACDKLQMRAWLWAVLAAGVFTGCQPSYGDVCYDICKKGIECDDMRDPTEAERLECRQDCDDAELEANQSVERGEVTQACFDAVIDLFDCAVGLSCAELEGEDVPPECQDEVDTRNRACPEFTPI